LKRVQDPEVSSAKLDWKDFEAYVESVFSSFGFRTERNARLRKPRAEIDLVASRNSLAFAVDCKHWKRTVGYSSMLEISRRQIARAKRLIDIREVDRIVPIVITLHDESLYVLDNGVPIVPIHKISDFILNWEQGMENILVLASSSKQESLP